MGVKREERRRTSYHRVERMKSACERKNNEMREQGSKLGGCHNGHRSYRVSLRCEQVGAERGRHPSEQGADRGVMAKKCVGDE